MPDKNYEILAPAGSFESLFAAVRSGADAVYFGMKDFSARRNAENFSVDEMRKGVKYCKRNAVKTYLTLNIAVKEKELQSAFSLAKEAYFAGVDGFILSDLGLAKIIHEAMPDVEMHASTQMTINSPAPLKMLKELGFCRVVAAREMSKTELIKFCETAKALGIQVEVFVHGALCMCLSGQCLMSSVLGGRSGNRGLCAGPCRLPFTAEGGTGYDLSLKDLSLLDHIGELLEMGVFSFKIEGRMKRPEYIAAAVTACKTAAEKGFLDNETKTVLGDVFSRSGFTDGYFTGKTGREMFGVRTEFDALKSKKAYSVLHNLYRNEFPRIPIEISASVKQSEPVKVRFVSGEYDVFFEGGIPEPAKTKSASKEDIKALVSKLGGTPFYAEKIDVLLDEGLFVSATEINGLRRKCCEALSEKLETIPQRRFFDVGFKTAGQRNSSRLEIYAEFESKSQIPEGLKEADLFILPIENCDGTENLLAPVAVKLPKFIKSEEQIKRKLKNLKERGINKAFCGTLPTVALAKECGMQITGDIGLNVLNSQNAKVLEDIGLGEITLSAETDLKSARELKTSLKKGIFAYGRLPLMATANCPLKNGIGCEKCRKNGKITDRKGLEFPVVCKNGYVEILNSKPVFLADKKDFFEGLDYIVLSFSDETSEDCRKIIDGYISGAPPKRDFTRGLYFKDLQ